MKGLIRMMSHVMISDRAALGGPVAIPGGRRSLPTHDPPFPSPIGRLYT